MTRDRAVARGCPATTLPAGGALQAVQARFFSRRRAEMGTEAREPGHIGLPGPPALSCRPVCRPLQPPVDVPAAPVAFSGAVGFKSGLQIEPHGTEGAPGCIPPSRSSSRARATAWTARSAHGNCRSRRRTRNDAASGRGTGVFRYHLARRRGLTGRPGVIFFRRRTEMDPEAREPGHIGLPGPPALAHVARSAGLSQPSMSPRSPWRSRAISTRLGPRPLSRGTRAGGPPPPPAEPAPHAGGSGGGRFPEHRNTPTRRSGLIQRSPRFTT